MSVVLVQVSKQKRKYVYVAVPKSLIDKVDEIVAKGYYRTRNEFVVDAVRRRIEEVLQLNLEN